MLFSISDFFESSQYLLSIPRRKNNIRIVVIDSELKMKLNFSGMAFLVAELTNSEMFVIYLMGFEGKYLGNYPLVRTLQKDTYSRYSQLYTNCIHTDIDWKIIFS